MHYLIVLLVIVGLQKHIISWLLSKHISFHELLKTCTRTIANAQRGLHLVHFARRAPGTPLAGRNLRPRACGLLAAAARRHNLHLERAADGPYPQSLSYACCQLPLASGA